MIIDNSKGDKGISQGGVIGNKTGNKIVEISQKNNVHNNNIISLEEKINDVGDDQSQLNIVDPKRRRINVVFSHDTEIVEDQSGDNNMEINENPKNLREAGAVQQPLLGL